jgi:DNA modification methylase
MEMAAIVFPGSGRKLTTALRAGSRRQRRARAAQVDLCAIAAMPRRNDLLPDLKFETRLISGLNRPERRLRRDDPEHVSEVAKSIATFGVSRPPVITADGEIIDGLITTEAAIHLGLTEMPCIVVEHLSAKEIRVLRLALNRLGEKGSWDIDTLKLEFPELIDLDLSLEITGFAAPEIDLVLLNNEPVVDGAANNCPKPLTGYPAVTRLNDVWYLGRHRLQCADACHQESYDQLFAGAPAAWAVFADPPYNIPIQGFVTGQAHHGEFVMGVGEMSDEQFVTFLSDFLKASSKHLADGGVLFVCMDHRHAEHVSRATREAGLSVVTLVVWYKGVGGMGRLYRSAHELVFVLKKGEAPVINNIELGKNGRDRKDVWEYPGANRRGSPANKLLDEHSTPKPVELVADALLDVTDRGDIVIDPFLGSGTTIIAAEKTGRTAYGLELDPHYCDVIIRRFEKFTGVTAVHAVTGLSFNEMGILRTTESELAAQSAVQASDV